MIFVKNEGHYILLSQDDNMLDTIKQSVPNAKIVNIGKEEYNQYRDSLEDLETIVKSRYED